MTSQYKVFHRPCDEIRKKLHIILVRPTVGGNIGAAARAVKNMGVLGRFIIVGDPSLVDGESHKFAKHASDILNSAVFATSLNQVKELLIGGTRLIASTARVGSP